MPSPSRYCLVFVTAPDLPTARRLSRKALEARLIACTNLIPRLESHYWWQGKLETGAEVLMVLKTTQSRLAELELLILALHPYDTAEFLVLPVLSGSTRYLTWLGESVAPDRARRSIRTARKKVPSGQKTKSRGAVKP